MSFVQIPESPSTVQVFVIDTTAQLKGVNISHFLGPDLQGLETFSACAFAFLVVHTDPSTGKKRRIIFDLGTPKDLEHDLPPALAKSVQGLAEEMNISKYVSEILEENGVALDGIEAVIWSHTHFDHIGRVSLFPSSVSLITGPGVKDAYYPGYPTVESSPILEREFAGREVKELDFTASPLEIVDLQAIDFFGDGSFYLLSAPGHAIGHVNALARTTAPTVSISSTDQSKATFILMGADSYHHTAQLRPSKHTPLPDEISGPIPHFTQYTSICPGHIFDVAHPSAPHRREHIPAHYVQDMEANHSDPRTTPYFTIASAADGSTVADNLVAAKDTIKTLQKFDADDRVLLVAAHDNSLYDLIDFFPKGANDWKSQGWKEKGRWRFLGDLKKAVELANEKAK